MAMTKADYKTALLDPHKFIRDYIMFHRIAPDTIREATGIPASTVRSYLNGGRTYPCGVNLSRLLRFVLVRMGEVDDA